jgi:hypothetical protein
MIISPLILIQVGDLPVQKSIPSTLGSADTIVFLRVIIDSWSARMIKVVRLDQCIKIHGFLLFLNCFASLRYIRCHYEVADH